MAVCAISIVSRGPRAYFVSAGVKMKHQQRGISFIGLLFVCVVLVCAGILAAQVFPTLVEFQAITKAAAKAREGNTVAEVRAIFDKAAAIDDIKSISGKDLEVTKEGDKTVVSFAYNKEIHMAGPAFLLLKYTNKSK
jgi:FlaG/FlaF family flagellin (archaellin)